MDQYCNAGRGTSSKDALAAGSDQMKGENDSGSNDGAAGSKD
jgi:hypothetical protein